MKEYSYKDVPTLKRFALDNTFMRAIVGPFGSGKSSACVIELWRRALAQEPSPDGIRRTRFAVVRNCYDDQTEILTEKRGWQLFKDLIIGEDRVATVQDNFLKYESPEGIAKHWYEGEMIGFESESVDFLVTPEHKLWVSTRKTRKKIWKEFELEEAQSVFGKELRRVKKNVEWVGEEYPGFTNDIFEYLGFGFAEGYYHLKNGFIISQNTNLEYMHDLFRRAGLQHKTLSNLRQFKLINNNKISEEIYGIFSEAGKSLDKKIPLSILSSTVNNLRSFLTGFLNGDGSIDSLGTTRLYTSSKVMADQLQEIIIKAGLASNLLERDRVGKEIFINGRRGITNSKEYILTLLSEKKYRPTLHRDHFHNSKRLGWYRKQYKGFVYCAEMNFPLVMTRRNGKTLINSRSYPQIHDTTIPTFNHWIEHLGEWKIAHNEFHMNTQAPDGSPVQSVIHFRPLDKPTDIKNLLSLEVTAAWFNEMREIPKSIIDAMRGRVGRFPPKDKDKGFLGATWKGIWGDTNPPDVDHPFYKLFEEDQPHACKTCRTPKNQMVVLPSRRVDNSVIPLMERKCPMCKKGIEAAFPLTAVFHQPSGISLEAENLDNLPPDYYQMLGAGMDRDFCMVYVEGKYGYVKEGKPVYLNYDPDWNYSKEPLKARAGYPLIISFDNTGLTQACVISQYLPNGQFRVLHEWLVEGIGTRRLSRDLVRPFVYSTYPGIQLFLTGDPAGVKRADTDERNTFEEITEAFGIQATPARSNAWQSRFNAVDSFLTKRIGKNEPGLLLSSECKMLHRGFMGEYRLKRLQVVSQEKFVNRPEKNLVANVHDALQYGAMFVEDMHDLMRRDRIGDSQQALQMGAGDWGAFS